MRTMLTVSGALLTTGIALMLLVDRRGAAEDQPAKPLSARELGKAWRYPGTGNDAEHKDDKFIWEFYGPLDGQLKNLDRTTMQFGQPKAAFAEVWNFYADKCGYGKKWAKNSFHMVIEQTKDGNQRMVMDQTEGQRKDSDGVEETHFALITEKYVVHVEIRKVDAGHTAIRILTTVR